MGGVTLTCVGIVFSHIAYLLATVAFVGVIAGWGFGYWIGRRDGYEQGVEDTLSEQRMLGGGGDKHFFDDGFEWVDGENR